jgi:hypothetical protein
MSSTENLTSNNAELLQALIDESMADDWKSTGESDGISMFSKVDKKTGKKINLTQKVTMEQKEQQNSIFQLNLLMTS